MFNSALIGAGVAWPGRKPVPSRYRQWRGEQYYGNRVNPLPRPNTGLGFFFAREPFDERLGHQPSGEDNC